MFIFLSKKLLLVPLSDFQSIKILFSFIFSVRINKSQKYSNLTKLRKKRTKKKYMLIWQLLQYNQIWSIWMKLVKTKHYARK